MGCVLKSNIINSINFFHVVLAAMDEDSSAVPDLLTEYILKGEIF